MQKQFTDSNKIIKELLKKSSRSASGGNLQPWKIFVLNKASMKNFLIFQEAWDKPEKPYFLVKQIFIIDKYP